MFMFDIKKIPKHTARAACHKFWRKAYPSYPGMYILWLGQPLAGSQNKGPHGGTCAVKMKEAGSLRTQEPTRELQLIRENKASTKIDRLLK